MALQHRRDVRDQESNPIATRDAGRDQGGGEAVDPLFQFGIGPRTIAVDNAGSR